jgi:MinD-like ATPase involved in chromosome partitioning or flagellar assembly
LELTQYRLYDGFDEPDTIAFGLPAAQLMVVVGCALSALLLLRSPIPKFASIPPALLLAAVGGALGWLRWQERPLLEWAVLAAKFAVRNRGAGVLLASEEPPATPPSLPTPAPPSTPAPTPAPPPQSRQPLNTSGPPRKPDWRQWLEDPQPQAEPEPIKAEEPVLETPNAEQVDQSELTFEDAAPALALVETVVDDEELPEGDLEVDDEVGVIIPFTKARGEDESEDVNDMISAGAAAVADEIELGTDPPPTAFIGATRRVTFFSLNGGSGKTTLCTEVASMLAARGEHTPNGVTKQRLKVAIVDLDLRSASVSVRLGIPQPTIWDYATRDAGKNDSVQDYMVTHKTGVKALLGPPKPVPASNQAIDPERVADIVAELEADGFHYIFFDVASDLNPTTTWVLNSAHDIFIVLTATATGVQDAYRTAETLRRMGLRHKLSYVVNKSRSTLNFATTMNDLHGKLVAEIPYDTRVEDAENSHTLVVENGGPAADAIRRLAATIYPALAPGQRKPRMTLPWKRRRA